MSLLILSDNYKMLYSTDRRPTFFLFLVCPSFCQFVCLYDFNNVCLFVSLFKSDSQCNENI